MKNWWQSLSIGIKLNIPIQIMLVAALTFAQFWIMGHIKEDILNGAERRAMVSADGIINGMNMLMVTGMISNPENRRLFIKKMGASENVKELRIVRAKQVQDQFGPGLPEEQAKDDLDRRAIMSKQPQFQLKEDPNSPTLRTVVPFIVSTNFRGTNCLNCHHVEVGSVNGAASIILDMTEEYSAIKRIRLMLLLGQTLLQILLFFSIHLLIRKFMSPMVKLQSTMGAMQRRGSMEQFVPIELDKGGLDEIGKLTVAFNHMAEALSESEKSMKLSSSIYQTNADAIMVTDENNLIVDINPAFTKITGYTLDEVAGKDPKIMKSGRHDKEFYRQMWQAILNEGEWHGELWDRRKNGEIFVKSANINVLYRSDGSVYRYVEQFSDITEKKQKDELIYRQANYDQLTSLPNRRLLMDRLQQALASSARRGREGALLFIDLDNFKNLNDTLGHDIGDILLQQVTQRLETSIREGDTVARLGGDEFVVMLLDLSEQPIEAAAQVEAVGEKILAALSQSYQLGTHTYRCTASIGVTLFSGNQLATDELMKQADIAMYQAKKAGRNALRFFDQQMQKNISARVSLEDELHNAIGLQQFCLFYQIQVDNEHRQLGAEALIRWIHPERGMVSPNSFIPLAEETGLILPIGLWVLETACAQLKVWQQGKLTGHLTLAVNVSAKQFRQADFADQVQAAMQRHGIKPKLLKLELTESLLQENILDTIATMNTLKEIGVEFSLDDFGSGYSSLQYLKRLPLDQLKIDRSFVRDVATDSSDKAIVRTIIAMAHSLNIDVIAEGVETEEQRQLLLENGCIHYQGYYFGRPAPIEEFEATIKRR
jgi:diguanylate cyclase (GGDEF)-like protein/PAS domain S-box-containing protein